MIAELKELFGPLSADIKMLLEFGVLMIGLALISWVCNKLDS